MPTTGMLQVDRIKIRKECSTKNKNIQHDKIKILLWLIFHYRCINGGKSDFNEDQATATDLLLKSHLRTDIARSCLDINLLHSLPKSQTPSPGPGSPNFNCSKPGPGSPNFNCSKLNSPSNSPRRRHTIKQISVDPESSDDDSTEADHNQTKPQLISTALSSETELIDFVSSGSHKTDSAQSPASRKKLPAPKTLNIATPHNHVNHHEEMVSYQASR